MPLISGIPFVLARLPAPPLWERWLLEQPVTAAIVLAGIGAIAGHIVSRRAGLKTGVLVLGGCLLAAAGVYALGSSVTTTREHLRAESRRFVERFVAGDGGTIGSMLSDRLSLRSGGEMVDQGKGWVVLAATGTKGMITDFSYSSEGAAVDGPNVARTRFFVRATVDGAGVVPSEWELGWQKEGERWVIRGIECRSMYGRPPSEEWVRWGSRYGEG